MSMSWKSNTFEDLRVKLSCRDSVGLSKLYQAWKVIFTQSLDHLWNKKGPTEACTYLYVEVCEWPSTGRFKKKKKKEWKGKTNLEQEIGQKNGAVLLLSLQFFFKHEEAIGTISKTNNTSTYGKVVCILFQTFTNIEAYWKFWIAISSMALESDPRPLYL